MSIVRTRIFFSCLNWQNDDIIKFFRLVLLHFTFFFFPQFCSIKCSIFDWNVGKTSPKIRIPLKQRYQASPREEDVSRAFSAKFGIYKSIYNSQVACTWKLPLGWIVSVSTKIPLFEDDTQIARITITPNTRRIAMKGRTISHSTIITITVHIGVCRSKPLPVYTFYGMIFQTIRSHRCY
mgnify:CR=1 FL=1